MTTQDTGYGYPGYLRCPSVADSGINLRFMIPVPEQALLPQFPLSPELEHELEAFRQLEEYILAEAEILYRLSAASQMSFLWQHHSCDYQELNSVFHNWKPGFDAGHFLYSDKEDEPMPVSKNGKAYYTKEQYAQAKYNSSALEYAKSRGYELVQQNQYYIMKEHDSMVFTPQGSWFWNSRGIHGGAIEFQMYYEGKTITEAVLALADDREMQRPQPIQAPKKMRAAPSQNEVPHTAVHLFHPPARAENFRPLFRYLCAERGLSKDVVQEMIRQGRLYQSDVKTTGRFQISNAVFLYHDPDGKPVGAFQRGMAPVRPGQEPYKRDSPASDKRWGWMLASPVHPATEVRVFEGAIDAASDASLAENKYGEDWRQERVDRLSLEGLGIQPLENYLKNHPDIQRVTLMLDGDEPGRKAADTMAEKIHKMGVTVDNRRPSLGMKDWNEVLLETRAIEQEQQSYFQEQQTDVPEYEP